MQNRSGVWQNHPFDHGMRNIALMPESYVLIRRYHVASKQSRATGNIFGTDRIPLMGHGRRPFLTLSESFLDLSDFAPLKSANFHRHFLERCPD